MSIDPKDRERAAEEYATLATGLSPKTQYHLLKFRLVKMAYIDGWDACAEIKDREIAELKKLLHFYQRAGIGPMLADDMEIAALRAKVEKLERVAKAARGIRREWTDCSRCMVIHHALAALDEKEGGV